MISRTRTASRTELRLTPSISAMVRSGGSLEPTCSRPAVISCLM